MLKTESAGGVIMNAKGEIALVKNGPDFWGFPKGHIDPGEDALTAAKREIFEETGLKNITLVRELPKYERYRGLPDGSNDDTSELKSIHMFLFTTDEVTLSPIDPRNPEARWVRLKDVARLLTNQKIESFSKAVVYSLTMERKTKTITQSMKAPIASTRRSQCKCNSAAPIE